MNGIIYFRETLKTVGKRNSCGSRNLRAFDFILSSTKLVAASHQATVAKTTQSWTTQLIEIHGSHLIHGPSSLVKPCPQSHVLLRNPRAVAELLSDSFTISLRLRLPCISPINTVRSFPTPKTLFSAIRKYYARTAVISGHG